MCLPAGRRRQRAAVGADCPEQWLRERPHFLEYARIRVVAGIICICQFDWQYRFREQFDDQCNHWRLDRDIRIDGYIHDGKPECSLAAAAGDEPKFAPESLLRQRDHGHRITGGPQAVAR